MNVHKNAKQTPRGRERLVRLVLSGLSPERASRLGGISPRALRKWVARFKADGVEGLMDRSSRPHHLRAVTPEPVVRRIIALRRLRWTGKHIARETGVSPATVSRVLHRGTSGCFESDPCHDPISGRLLYLRRPFQPCRETFGLRHTPASQQAIRHPGDQWQAP